MSTNRVTVSPLYLSFPQWTGSVIVERGSLPQARGEDRWKDWAAEVVRVDGTVPDPRFFKNWRVWALAWIQAQ